MQAQGRDGEIETRLAEGQGRLVADDRKRRAECELRQRRQAGDAPSLLRQPRGKLRRSGTDLDDGGEITLDEAQALAEIALLADGAAARGLDIAVVTNGYTLAEYVPLLAVLFGGRGHGPR